jgi:hypothetical protein
MICSAGCIFPNFGKPQTRVDSTFLFPEKASGIAIFRLPDGVVGRELDMELLDSVDLMLHGEDSLVELFLGDSKGIAAVVEHLSS